MANMATMRPALMASESVQSYLTSIKFQENTGTTSSPVMEYAEIHDGALVVRGELAPNEPYNTASVTNMKDDNVYLATAPAAVTDEVVIVDLAEVSQGVIAGNTYKIGIKLVGLVCQAGYPARARIPMKHDKYWLSGDCFASQPTVGQFATATANSTLHTPAATAATSGYCVKIEDSRAFTVGNRAAASGYQGILYLVRVL